MTVCLIKEGGQNYEEVDTPRTRYREYDLRGYPTYEEAEAALLADPEASFLHPVSSILLRKDWSLDEFDTHPGEWRARVNWERWTPDIIGDEKISGSISLQTVNVNYAFNHVGDFAAAGQSPIRSYGGLNLKMNENNTFTPQGLSVEFPLLTFTIEKTYEKGFSNVARIINLNDFIGRPNEFPWRGLGPQTVRLKAADVQDHDDNEDLINFTFEMSPTLVNIVIPSPLGDILVPQKLGFQLLSITSIPITQDGDSDLTIDSPHTAHIDEPSPLCDLNLIL